MEDTPTISVTRRVLNLLHEGEPPSDIELARALDELSMAYHQCPEGDPAESDVSPAKTEYHERYALICKRFDALGHYSISVPLGPVDQECIVSDAIDDLADIAGDLQEVLWRFENAGADEAHWYFRMLYEIHWGRHLRELSFYLHARIW